MCVEDIQKTLKRKLKDLRYQEREKNIWEYSSRRASIVVSFYKKYFEVFVREYPLREGWYRDQYDYEEGCEKHIPKY